MSDEQTQPSTGGFLKGVLTTSALLIIPAIVGGIQIYEFFTKPKTALAVTADYGPFSFPPGSLGGVTDDTFKLEGFLSLVITNTGSNPAEDLALDFRGRSIASIGRSSGRESKEFADRLDLGTLKVNDTVTVKLWTEFMPVADANEPVVSATAFGTQRVSLSRKVAQSSFLQPLLTLVASGVVGGASAAVFGYRFQQRAKAAVDKAMQLQESIETLQKESKEAILEAKDLIEEAKAATESLREEAEKRGVTLELDEPQKPD